MNKILDVFLLPYAGGNKYSYRQFKEKAPSFLNLVTLEYPGRGARFREPLLSDINDIVDDLYDQVKRSAVRKDYVIYGHSLGGLLAYLLTVRLIESNFIPPLQLFITGTTGPSSVSRKEKMRHLMEESEFIQEIKNLNGIPGEILENEEMLKYFEPILRSDFKASETYVYKDRQPLSLPLTVITGVEEEMEIADIHLWQKETVYKVDFKRFPGNHFFIFDNSERILEIIAKKLIAHTKVYDYE